MVFRNFIISLVFICLTLSLAAQRKRALIIAIGDYDKYETQWKPIGSANDVPLITDALVSQGFENENITVLKDRDASYDAIKTVLNSFYEDTRPGDIIYIHYSGHGQQIFDDNGDEEDGWDEALIPVNAHQFFKKNGYQGEYHLRDDEFGSFLTQVRTRAGSTGNVLVVIDACHSGTSTRGDAVARGSETAFAPPDYSPENASESGQFGVYTESSTMAPMACFFGASAHQLNFEYKLNDSTSVGSLSFAFSKAFSEAGPEMTYQGLFDRIKIEMASIAPNQIPQAEGTLNQYILGGTITGQPDYALILKYYDNENLTINKGILHGVNPGCRVGLYDIDVRDISKATPYATGKVIYSDYSTADVVLDQPTGEEQIYEYWVYVTEYNYGDLRVKVKLDLKNKPLEGMIREKIKAYPMILIDETEYDLIVEENNKFTRGNNIVLNSVKDIELLSIVAAQVDEQKAASDIVLRIAEFAQSRFLRSLESEDTELMTEMELIPTDYTQQGRHKVPGAEYGIETKTDVSGNIVFYEGDGFRIKVTNKGSKAIYFTIIDIMPDDKILVHFPASGKQASDYRLERGATWTSPLMWFEPPYGMETFKLIASESPMDLRTVIVSRGESGTKEGNPNPFQTLFSETYMNTEVKTRSGVTSNVPSGSVHIHSIVFEIREKQK